MFRFLNWNIVRPGDLILKRWTKAVAWVTKSDDYRRKAAEADKEAEQAKDAEAKRTLHEVAENYRKLAKQAERDRC
jgi:hypothetical protein